MQAERWRRVEQLYHTAIEQEEEQRADFLARLGVAKTCMYIGDLLREGGCRALFAIIAAG